MFKFAKDVLKKMNFGRGFHLEIDSSPDIVKNSKNDEIINKLDKGVEAIDTKYMMSENTTDHASSQMDISAVSRYASSLLVQNTKEAIVDIDTFMEDVDLPAIITDKEGRIIKTNSEMEDLVKGDNSKILNKGILDVIGNNTFGKINKFFFKAINNSSCGQPTDNKISCQLNLNGKTEDVEIEILSIKDNNLDLNVVFIINKFKGVTL